MGEANDPVVPLRVAMVGNPNVGKTSLFNRMCGVRAKTANFPGSTVEARVGAQPRERRHSFVRSHISQVHSHTSAGLGIEARREASPALQIARRVQRKMNDLGRGPVVRSGERLSPRGRRAKLQHVFA
jgi:hypothetical protein